MDRNINILGEKTNSVDSLGANNEAYKFKDYSLSLLDSNKHSILNKSSLIVPTIFYNSFSNTAFQKNFTILFQTQQFIGKKHPKYS